MAQNDSLNITFDNYKTYSSLIADCIRRTIAFDNDSSESYFSIFYLIKNEKNH